MNSNRGIARNAGIVYLIVVVFGVFAQLVRTSLIVPADAAATAANIRASEVLFRLAIVSDLVMMTAFLFLPLVLYRLLENIDRRYAFIMVLLVVVSIPINCLNLLNEYTALHMLTEADYLGVFPIEEVQAQALLSLNLYEFGYLIADVFFGLWLLPLGLLVYQSGYFPKILGVLLVLACFGHLGDVLTTFLFTDARALAYPGLGIATVAEISFCLWLLVRGAREAVPTPPSIAAAAPVTG